MAILTYCSECNKYLSRKKIESNKNRCPDCDSSMVGCRKFRVMVHTPHNGKITQVVEGTLTFAKNVEAKLKTDVSKKKHFKVGPAPKIDVVWKRYLKWAKKNKKSWYDDRNRWELHVEPYVRDMKMDAITRGKVRHILGRMEDTHSPATIKHVYALMRRIYNWAIEHDYYSGNVPTKKIKPPKVNNEVTACLTTNEVEKLLKTLDEWSNQLAALVVKFALFTGMRQDEILGLEWNNIDLERKFVRLDDPKGNPTNIPISDRAIGVVEKARSLQPFHGCPYVFPNRKGDRRVTFFHIWDRIRKASGIRETFRFHDLRHTFASYLASSGEVDIYTLQKLLNHQDPKMTQRYAHLLDEALRRGANVADKVFGHS